MKRLDFVHTLIWAPFFKRFGGEDSKAKDRKALRRVRAMFGDTLLGLETGIHRFAGCGTCKKDLLWHEDHMGVTTIYPCLDCFPDAHLRPDVLAYDCERCKDKGEVIRPGNAQSDVNLLAVCPDCSRRQAFVR